MHGLPGAGGQAGLLPPADASAAINTSNMVNLGGLSVNNHNHQPLASQQHPLDDGGAAGSHDPEVNSSAGKVGTGAIVAASNAVGAPISPSNDDQDGEGGSDDDGDDANREDGEGIWSPDIEQSFQEALAIYPPCGRRKIILSDEGKMFGRNELIARYIKVRTGKIRTRKQVSSHIQVLARKKARELQSRLKEAQNDKEHGVLHSILQTLPGMSSAQIVSTQFHGDQEEQNAGVAGASASAGGGSAAAPGPPNNHMATHSDTFHNAEGAQPLTSIARAQHVPRTVGVSSAAALTTGSNSIVVKNEPGQIASVALSNASGGATHSMWPAMRGFPDQLTFGGGPPGMVPATPPGFIMTPQSLPGVHHMPLVPRLPQPCLPHMTGGGLCSSFMLVELTAFREEASRADASENALLMPPHCFIHIPPDTNFLSPSLESIDIGKIYDKFPQLDMLYDLGPQGRFFLVKFWADINVPTIATPGGMPFYGYSTTYRSPEAVSIKCRTKVCSFGSQVVEKVEIQSSKVENGQHILRLHRSTLCDYMVKFIHKLVGLNDREKMNNVLENFTILQLVTNGTTDELLLCLAFVFEVCSPDSQGPNHNIYRLVKEWCKGSLSTCYTGVDIDTCPVLLIECRA